MLVFEEKKANTLSYAHAPLQKEEDPEIIDVKV